MLLSVLILSQALAVFANTEKVIFLGPSALQVPVQQPTLTDLRLDTLTPQHWSLRMHIEADFPSNSSRYGQASWFLLHNLHEGQRYEVRVCWAATEPTSFRLDTYTLPTVFETPELITSLAHYSEQRQAIAIQDVEPSLAPAENMPSEDVAPLLFLRVFAAADYYTVNSTLMQHAPAVHVDIILDPFIFNVFPRSLLSTAAYILLLAFGSWYLASFASRWIGNISKAKASQKKKE